MTYGPSHFPEEIRKLTQERQVEIDWAGGETFRYSMEYLRVACPCAECRGHQPSQRRLIDGQREVTVEEILPVGNYAVKLVFSDGHDSGVYSWDTLHDLGARFDFYWQDYLAELASVGKNREECTLPLSRSCPGSGGGGGCHG